MQRYSRILNLLIAVILIAASLLTTPARIASAAGCSLSGVNELDIYDDAVGSQRTIKDAKSIKDALAVITQLRDRSFQTYRGDHGGKFVSSTGVVLASNDPAHYVHAAWQYYNTYMFGVDLAKEIVNPDGSITVFKERFTVLVAWHAAVPDKAYWFIIPQLNAGNEHPYCGAFETSRAEAAALYAQVDGLPD